MEGLEKSSLKGSHLKASHLQNDSPKNHLLTGEQLRFTICMQSLIMLNFQVKYQLHYISITMMVLGTWLLTLHINFGTVELAKYSLVLGF